jgi:peptidoglycan/LPS O-acetylase OafA/YrhL
VTALPVGGEKQRGSTRSAPLDGIRALAVVAVVAFHAHNPWAVGGYVGVDVFFVLSGYLITGVLLSTHRSWWGYRQFLVRRAVRLVPALVVATCGAATVAVLTEVPAPVGRCSAVSLGYVMNLPFAESLDCTALWHITWSLAAEQQFYVVWPLVLAALALLLRRARSGRGGRGRGLALAAGFCALAYGAGALWQLALRSAGEDTARVDFSPDGRSLVLLVGCGLALLVAARRARRRPRTLRRADGVAVLSLLALGWCITTGDLTAAPWGLVPLLVSGVATAGLIWALVHAPATSRVAQVLGAGPVAWLGRVSYSLYLWHEIAYRLVEQVGPRGSLSAELLRFPLALSLAAASYYGVELPAQRWWQRRTEEPEPAVERERVSA